MRKRIYTDTSVIGGCLDVEFDNDSLALFKNFNSGASIIVLSSLTLAELERASQDVKKEKADALPPLEATLIPIGPE